MTLQNGSCACRSSAETVLRNTTINWGWLPVPQVESAVNAMRLMAA